MLRTKIEHVTKLLRSEGATAEEATRIVRALEAAGLEPSRMKAWLSHPQRSYGVSVGAMIQGVDFKQVPTHAIEGGRADAVIAAAEDFAAASADERFISLACLCDLDAVRRLTHGDADRTAKVVRIAKILTQRMRKDVLVNETLQTTFSGDLEDTTRLVDWMLDERLDQALSALESGELDPVALHRNDMMFFVGW